MIRRHFLKFLPSLAALPVVGKLMPKEPPLQMFMLTRDGWTPVYEIEYPTVIYASQVGDPNDWSPVVLQEKP